MLLAAFGLFEQRFDSGLLLVDSCWFCRDGLYRLERADRPRQFVTNLGFGDDRRLGGPIEPLHECVAECGGYFVFSEDRGDGHRRN